MAQLIRSHLSQDDPAAFVPGGKPRQVLIEMTLDLALRLGHEAAACTISERGGKSADRKRACIPEGVQTAGARAELGEARFAPGEMIGFLARRREKPGAGLLGSRRQSLPVVEGLSGDLSGMVDAHEGGRAAAVLLAERGFDRGGGAR